MHQRPFLLAAFSFAILAIGARGVGASGPYVYHLTDLGIATGESASYAYGINSSGQSVGYSQDATMMMNPAPPVFQASSPNGLFTPAAANLGAGYGYAINNSGQATGFDGNNQYHAVRIAPGQSVGSAGTDLGTLGGSLSQGYGINASGQVAGWAYTAGGAQIAFRTSATGLASDPGTSLGTFSGGSTSFARGINASGQTVGYGTTAGNFRNAFRTSATGVLSGPGADLGVLAGRTDSDAYGINASGQVAGVSFASSMMGGPSPHAFRTSATGDLTDAAADLGTLPGDMYSFAYAINDTGWVVGDSGGHSMLQDGTTMYDLSTLMDASGTGWQLQPMRGINNSDQIVGSAYSPADGLYHAVRLDLVSSPEPSSCVAACVAGAGLLLRRRRVK